MKYVRKSTGGLNGSTKLPGLPDIKAGSGNLLKNNKGLQMQEMHEINANLEELVEQRTKELFDVVASNSKFLSILAHDLRNPFISIVSVMEILKKSLHKRSADEIEKLINSAHNSANQTLNLIDNLLAWIISQNKDKSLIPVKINLHELLSYEIEILNNSVTQKLISLNHTIDPGLNISADIQMVKMILRNLITNAIKFTHTGGKITISAKACNPFVEIAVKDNGIGISQEVQGKLFKTGSFYTTPGTHDEKGSGLGLLLCKEFVELHGGSIQIESELGNGCEFKFTLPHYI